MSRVFSAVLVPLLLYSLPSFAQLGKMEKKSDPRLGRGSDFINGLYYLERRRRPA